MFVHIVMVAVHRCSVCVIITNPLPLNPHLRWMQNEPTAQVFPQRTALVGVDSVVAPGPLTAVDTMPTQTPTLDTGQEDTGKKHLYYLCKFLCRK